MPLDTAITFTEPKLQKESQKKGKSEKANEKDDAVLLAQNKDEIDKKNALKPEKSSLLLLGHRPPLATPKKDAAIKPTEKEAEPVEIVAKSEKVDKMEKNGAEKDKKPIYIPPAAKKDSTSTEIVVGKAVNSPATPVTEVKNKQHRVAIGDNPYKIARLYNISLEKLYELNNLPSGSPIAAGQILRVE